MPTFGWRPAQRAPRRRIIDLSFLTGSVPRRLRDNAGASNSYCSGNVFDLPVGRTRDEGVTLRRHLARQVVAILNEAEALKGDERAGFVRERMEALQQDVLARRHA